MFNCPNNLFLVFLFHKPHFGLSNHFKSVNLITNNEFLKIQNLNLIFPRKVNERHAMRPKAMTFLFVGVCKVGINLYGVSENGI